MVCQLHANKLPLYHFFQHFDRHIAGHRYFTGTIIKHLNGCEKLQTVDFVPIKTSLPETNYLSAGYR
jgi:hypothetical protein